MAASARFTEDFAYEVLSVVAEIPEGTVATYGQIARLIGRDKNSRLVARVLSHASDYGEFPCHRVVNHAGRLFLPVFQAFHQKLILPVPAAILISGENPVTDRIPYFSCRLR